MKKSLLSIAVIMIFGSLVIFSCKKEDKNSTNTNTTTGGSTTSGTTGGVTINSTPQVSYTINGSNFSYVANGTTVHASVGASTNFVNPGGYGSYSTSVDDGNSITYLDIEKGTLTWASGANPDSASFVNFFPVGAVAYSSNAVNGIEITMYDATGTYWSTSYGSQTGSTFNIDAIKQEWLGGSQYMKIKATFTCTLFDSSGNSKVLTNGVYVGHFENM